MPQYFTVRQAESLLPEVEKALRDALFQKAEYEAAEDALRAKLSKIRLAGGSRVSPGPLLVDRERRDANGALLKKSFEHLEELGVQVKDLDIGLIDFLTHYHGREVCLCWKLGETGITHWHDMEDGFRGRKPIDDEFLANHKGEAYQ